MASITQYPIAKPTACPFLDCKGTEFEYLSGASEAALFEMLDSNKTTLHYRCKTCKRDFLFEYKFNLTQAPKSV